MFRWPRLPYPYVWSSGLVLIALCAVLIEIRHVRQRRLRAAFPVGIETILHSRQLTYVAEPVDEPRQLPIDLIDRGLPLSLQENYAAQRSDYHPARASQQPARRLPTPIPAIDEASDYEEEAKEKEGVGADDDRGVGNYFLTDEKWEESDGTTFRPRANRTESLEIHSGSPPMLQAPDRSGFERERRPVESSYDSPDDSTREEEHDVLQDVLQRIPPTYPNVRRRFPESAHSVEIQSSYSEDPRSDENVVMKRIRQGVKESQGAATTVPTEPLFPAPEASLERKAASGNDKPYWSVTRWSRSRADEAAKAPLPQ